MSFDQSKFIHRMITTIILVVIISPMIIAQDHYIELKVGDVTALPGETAVEVPVYLYNPVDTLIGIKIWIILDQPDIMEFTYDLDLTGSPIEGWDIITRSLSGTLYDLQITLIEPILSDIPLLPQTGGIPLFTFTVDVYDIPDTAVDRTVQMMVQKDFVGNIEFVNNHIENIGYEWVPFIDTSYFICHQWAGADCIDSSQTTEFDDYDFIHIAPDSSVIIDTTVLNMFDGSLTVLNAICGDINNSGDLNISDLTYLIAYMFTNGPPPYLMETADCNGDSDFTISDLTCFVCFFFDYCEPSCPNL